MTGVIIMIEALSLSFTRQAQTLFQNIHFTLNPGDLLQIQGANGSGKSTLLRILAGFLRLSSGDIRYQQTSIYESASQYQNNIAYLGHTNAIKPAFTVTENLVSYCRLMGLHSLCPIDSLLEAFCLKNAKKKFAYQLSAGQQRKLAFVKLLLSQKSIWLLDEPTVALDKAGVETFIDQLEKHLAAGGIVIMATHQPFAINTQSIHRLSL
jgi:heme exporter protein A